MARRGGISPATTATAMAAAGGLVVELPASLPAPETSPASGLASGPGTGSSEGVLNPISGRRASLVQIQLPQSHTNMPPQRRDVPVHDADAPVRNAPFTKHEPTCPLSSDIPAHTHAHARAHAVHQARSAALETRRRSSLAQRWAASRARRISTYSLDDAFLTIALRVSVYPIMAIILNTLYIGEFVLCVSSAPPPHCTPHRKEIRTWACRELMFQRATSTFTSVRRWMLRAS